VGATEEAEQTGARTPAPLPRPPRRRGGRRATPSQPSPEVSRRLPALRRRLPALRRRPPALRKRLRPRPLAALSLARRTIAKAWHDRVLGLAAEAAFWQLLSLPPLLLAVLGTIGYLGDLFGSTAVDRIEHSLLDGAANLLTADVVNDVVRPTVDEILRRGRPDVISIGFLLSLWTGSAAMSTYVNTITIAYEQRNQRSAIRSRLLALRLYAGQVAIGVIVLPGLVLGPDLLQRILGAEDHPIVRTLTSKLYWPLVALLSLALLTTLYHLALPKRQPWRRAVPGAVFALLVWVLGGYGLRLYLTVVFGNELIYGSLAAPVAVLLFFYISALACLLGAELNATVDRQRIARARAEEEADAAEDPARTTAGTTAEAATGTTARPAADAEVEVEVAPDVAVKAAAANENAAPAD
jgi:membrane protein